MLISSGSFINSYCTSRLSLPRFSLLKSFFFFYFTFLLGFISDPILDVLLLLMFCPGCFCLLFSLRTPASSLLFAQPEQHCCAFFLFPVRSAKRPAECGPISFFSWIMWRLTVRCWASIKGQVVLSVGFNLADPNSFDLWSLSSKTYYSSSSSSSSCSSLTQC